MNPSMPLSHILTLSISFFFSAVLCSERVGQITKTYHDIEAVTHLLEEVRDTTQYVTDILVGINYAAV